MSPIQHAVSALLALSALVSPVACRVLGDEQGRASNEQGRASNEQGRASNEQGRASDEPSENDHTDAACEGTAPSANQDPIGCPGGYCERDNRGSSTTCRSGFRVNVYAICGVESPSACCEPLPPAAPDAATTSVPDASPIDCPHGYCEPDNRGLATVCRAGFHVGVYSLCGLDSSACCLPD